MSSSSLWPKGNNKDLIISIANYLQTLSKQNASSLDEVSLDSLQIAVESLQTIINPDDDTLAAAPFSLSALYDSYLSQNLQEEEKKQVSVPSNIEKRKKKFLEFIQVLKQHNFFKDCVPESTNYNSRMEKARLQYNTRFPSMSIDSMDWIQNKPPASTKSHKEPMDEDIKAISVEDKKRAESLKAEGNKLLGQKKYKQAVDKYTEAIKCNSQNAVYFSNRSAAFTYLQKYKQAVLDARKASSIDPNYVKAYVREGLAEYELKDYQKAHDAYSKALNKTKSTDRNWENYMEKVELCKMKIDEANQVQNNEPKNESGAAPNANALNDLFSSLGGGDGGAGLDFSKLMQNPMMSQMAQQMMQDPNAMKKMGDLLGSMGGASGGRGASAASGGSEAAPNDMSWMTDLMQNPQKAQQIFQKAMEDQEVKEMMKEDPSIAPLINRIKNGDQSAFMELGSKPGVMEKVRQLIQKYYNEQ